MSSLDLKPKSTSEIDHRKSVLSLRWLLVILASYLTLFSYLGSDGFPVVFVLVSIFYIFLSDRLTQDAKLSNAMMEENRIAEVMVEITRALSTSLNTEDVLFSIVSRLCEVLEAQQCSIVRIDPKTGAARILLRVPESEQKNIPIKL